MIFVILLAFSSCRVAKDFNEGEMLLVKNNMEIKPSTSLDEETVQNIVKQKPNTKLFFFFRFNAWIYNKFDEDKLALKREKKQLRIDRKNEKREKKGKTPSAESNETWRDRIVKNIGEKPVVYDSLKTEKSIDQLEVYFQKNGYFSAYVEHELKQRTKRKVKSKYTITPGSAHKIGKIIWIFEDEKLAELTAEFEKRTQVKTGHRFSVEELDNDRERLTSYLNNSGYYEFSKDFIRFEIDTLDKNHTADVNVYVSNSKTESPFSPDSLVVLPHKKFIFGRVDFHLDFDPLVQDYDPTERLLEGKHTFEFIDSLDIDTELLIDNILIKEGDYYRVKDVQNTYKKLRNLGVFNYLNIQFEEDGLRGDAYNLRCHIYLNSSKSQGTSLELTGTHRDGIWGANIKTAYRHNNLAKGAESLEVKFTIGAEAVKPVSSTDNEDDFTQSINDNLRLNSLIIGPEVKLSLHKLVFLPKLTKKFSTPLTSISAVYNYQIRPDFERSLVELNFGYSYKESAKSSVFFSPFNWSVIQIDKSIAFQERLDLIGDLFLKNSYQDHFIPSFLSGNWNFSNQSTQFQRKYSYNMFSIESSGANFRLAYKYLGNQELDENGSYTLNKIRFAQYLKFENDYRHYRNFSKNHGLATRMDIGYALPYGNSNVLPFEKSFFAGGSNGIRAWQARSLGPGSYRDTTALLTYNNLGEVKINASSEYRFDLTNILEGAFFVDAGNVWILNDEDQKTGTELSKDFVSEIAIGAGLGFRFDFDFFLIRFDFGFKIKDPSLVPGERWFWQPKDDYEDYLSNLRANSLTDQTNYNYTPNFNLGIGYPF